MAGRLLRVRCPHCQAPTRVSETRAADHGGSVRRRRICSEGHRFTTFERTEAEPLFVRKRDGHRQRFDRTKLRAALLGAAHKRPVSARDVERVVDRIEAAGADAGGELTAERILELALEGLRDLDLGVYLQFAGTLADPASAISGDRDPGSPAGSVRLAREHAELPPKAASRRGFDE